MTDFIKSFFVGFFSLALLAIPIGIIIYLIINYLVMFGCVAFIGAFVIFCVAIGDKMRKE